METSRGHVGGERVGSSRTTARPETAAVDTIAESGAIDTVHRGHTRCHHRRFTHGDGGAKGGARTGARRGPARLSRRRPVRLTFKHRRRSHPTDTIHSRHIKYAPLASSSPVADDRTIGTRARALARGVPQILRTPQSGVTRIGIRHTKYGKFNNASLVSGVRLNSSL